MATRKEALDLLNNLRNQLDVVIAAEKNSPAIINALPDGIRPWNPGAFNVDDVRMYEGIPYKCVQAHDSKANPGWTPVATPALWMQYHGTSVETARAWIAPTGAHDMYKAGEYMVYTDGKTYKCLTDTVCSPLEDHGAWEEYVC